MWVRQCELDARAEAPAPIPSQIASNEEFIPPPQSPQQREYEARLAALSERAARRQGMSRRDFLRTGSGMAAALLALNQVFGDCYEVDAAEAEDQKTFEEKWPKDQFIFDVQTHHVDVSQKWYDDTPDGQRMLRFFRILRPSAATNKEALDLLNRAHYVKEVFGDSDTVMAIISGVPSRDWDKNPLPPDQMVATRQYVNDLAGSQRLLSHGLLRPNLGPKEFPEMERQVKELKIDAWKMYTGAEVGEQAWFMDDEKVAYPFWERSKKLGIKNLCVHKGLPLTVFNEKACTPLDLERAALDWPDLNFIVYHSGFRGFGLIGTGTGPKVEDKRKNDPQEIPWISDLIRILKKNPQIKNLYFELGATFNMTSSYAPETCMHMLGQMLQAAGPDHILWGTDSIWGGSP
jgi:predicted TIM-barrel fold metal-dependent hydrolase